MSLVPDVLLGVLCVVAIVTDWRERKIKNWLTFPTMLAGVGWWAVAGAQAWGGAAGLLLAFVVAVPFWWYLPALKAGDVKMLMAGGALLGPEPAARAVLLTLLLGLPAGLVVLAVMGRLGRFVRFVLRQEKTIEPTVVMHAPVVAAGLVLARVQGFPELW